MKKILCVVLCVVIGLLGLTLFGCNKPEDDTIDIAFLCSSKGTQSDETNKAVWTAIQDYAKKENLKAQTFTEPSSADDTAREDLLKAAVEKGATRIVTVGYTFEKAVYALQSKNAGVKFILLDGVPNDASITDEVKYEIAENSVSVLFDEYEIGYLAAYAAVKEGYTKLGFVGAKGEEAYDNYLEGYEAGAEAANGSALTIQTAYSKTATSSTIATTVNGWYVGGTESVFCAGGSIYLSAVSAANNTDGKLACIDKDPYELKNDGVNFAIKRDFGALTTAALTKGYADWSKAGGKTLRYGVDDDTIGAYTSDAQWQYTEFSVADWQAAVAELKAA